MPSFILRNLDPDFWKRVQAKALQEGFTVKAVILRLLAAWLGVLFALFAIGCSHNPLVPSTTVSAAEPAPLVLGLAGQSNSILMRPFLSQAATVVGDGDQVTTIDCWAAAGACWRGLEPTLHRKLDAFVWWQGESDALAATPPELYTARFNDLVRRIRQATGQPNLLIAVCQWGPHYVGEPDHAEYVWATTQPNALFIPTQDIAEWRWWDTAHATDAGYQSIVQRIVTMVGQRVRR